MIAGMLFSINFASAQEPHTVDINIDQIVQYYQSQLTYCDFDSIIGVIVNKDPTYDGIPYWIDQNDNVIHANSVIITEENDGKLVYIEKDNDLLISVNINLIENEMPAPAAHGIWLSEGMTTTLYPTEQNEGYLYAWESSNWPLDSIYQGYTIQVNEPGFYRCNMWDQCLHYSKVEYSVNQAPKIEYVTTNLFVNRNELHWIPDEINDYDTIAIFRDWSFVETWEYDMGIWVDPSVNNENASPIYALKPVKNGEIIDGCISKWKAGISLTLHHVFDQTIDISFYGPDRQDGVPLEEYIQYYQLYSVESTGWGLIRSMIPTDVNDLYDIENDYDTLIIAAVTFDGEEIYSNMIFPHAGITKCDENFEQNIQIYPNPTDGILNISASIDAEYKIFDLQGRVVKFGNLQQQINVSDLAKGLYTMQIIENGHKPYIEKFTLK